MIYYISYRTEHWDFHYSYASSKAEAYEFAKNILLRNQRCGGVMDSEVVIGVCNNSCDEGYVPDYILEVLIDRELTEDEKQVANYREYHPKRAY